MAEYMQQRHCETTDDGGVESRDEDWKSRKRMELTVSETREVTQLGTQLER